MPAGAVLASAVEVEPEIVVAHPVVRRQGVAGSNQPWVGGVGKLPVLRRQPRLEKPLTEEPPMVLLPGHPLGEPLEQPGGAGGPAGRETGGPGSGDGAGSASRSGTRWQRSPRRRLRTGRVATRRP